MGPVNVAPSDGCCLLGPTPVPPTFDPLAPAGRGVDGCQPRAVVGFGTWSRAGSLGAPHRDIRGAAWHLSDRAPRKSPTHLAWRRRQLVEDPC
jgi:hypothetical protein